MIPATEPTTTKATTAAADRTCAAGSSPCYSAQLGYAKGKPFYFYNAGTLTRLPAKLTPAMGSALIYKFEDKACNPGKAFDAVHDAYPQAIQFPIFTQLPGGNSTGPVLPLMRRNSASGQGAYTCNAYKTATSVGSADHPGLLGAKAQLTGDVELDMPVDLTLTLYPRGSALNVPIQRAWVHNLQLAYVSGGTLPLDAAGNLKTMNGVILDPPLPTGTFARVTDAKAVLFDATPGDPDYSPLVRLWDFTYPATQPLGTFKGICHSKTAPCGASDVDLDALLFDVDGKPNALPFNTLFLVASPQ